MNKLLIVVCMVLASFGLCHADLERLADYDRTHATLSAGYNWVETEDSSGRAAEYMYQDSSGTAAFDVRGGVDDKHYILDGKFLNENDYIFHGHFDRNNAQRLDLRIEKLFHNLDHYDYASRPDAVPVLVPPTATPRVVLSDMNPADEYSLKVGTYEANLRTKLPDMPSHLSIGYWQFQKEGEKQLRFVDENCAGACHMQSRTRELDRTTHQVTGSFDAHLGKVDLILKHTYRELVIDDPIPVDFFEAHGNVFSPKFRDTAGNYQHSADPESQLNESTLELHSSLAGGLNLAASGTFGKRKNNSAVTGVSPIVAETEYWKGAADITHTTSARFSYNFKARYLDMDATNTFPQLLDPFTTLASGDVDVRPPIDLERALYELNTLYRPSKKTTYKATLKLEQIKRTETGPALPFHSSSGGVFVNDPVWELPDEEIVTTAKLGFFTRPTGSSKFRVNGYYQYRNSDEPAYAASFEESHRVFLSTTCSVKPDWGLIASVMAGLDTNRNHPKDVIFDETTVPIIRSTIERDREREQENVNLGVWYHPAQDVTTSLNYGYSRTAIVQDLVFGTDPNNGSSSTPNYIIFDDDVDYLQEVHTVSGSLGFRVQGNMKVNLSGHYTRSLGQYDPNFPVENFEYLTIAGFGDATPDGLKEISRFDIDQYGARAAVDYYFSDDFELTLNYSYDEYDEKYNDDFDGSVQTAMAAIAYRW